jgi:hypothetical protein
VGAIFRIGVVILKVVREGLPQWAVYYDEVPRLPGLRRVLPLDVYLVPINLVNAGLQAFQCVPPCFFRVVPQKVEHMLVKQILRVAVCDCDVPHVSLG